MRFRWTVDWPVEEVYQAVSIALIIIWAIIVGGSAISRFVGYTPLPGSSSWNWWITVVLVCKCIGYAVAADVLLSPIAAVVMRAYLLNKDEVWLLVWWWPYVLVLCISGTLWHLIRTIGVATSVERVAAYLPGSSVPRPVPSPKETLLRSAAEPTDDLLRVPQDINE